MLRQLEGSRAVAETVARCRPQVIAAYPISPQTHIVEALSDLVRTGELAPCEYLMVESEFGALSACIGASAAGSRTYTATASQGLLFMAEALPNASGPRAADRDDGGQPRHRRAHQHLERPLRRHVAARRRVGPAVRRVQPGGRGPARPGVRARRAALAPRHGLHGRLRAHPRGRGDRRPGPGGGRRPAAAVLAAAGPRPRRTGHDRGDGRPRGVHRGEVPRRGPAAAGARRGPRRRGGVRASDGTHVRRPGQLLPHGRRGRSRSSPWARSSAPSRTSWTSCGRTGVPIGVVAVSCYRPWPLDEVRAALAGLERVVVLNRAFAVGSGTMLGQDVRLTLATSATRGLRRGRRARRAIPSPARASARWSTR